MAKVLVDAFARHPIKYTLGAIIDIGGLIALVAGLCQMI